MLLIECFTDAHVDNISACLRLRPEKLVMVGDGQKMQSAVAIYEKLLKNRGIATVVTRCDVGGKDLGALCAVFEDLIRNHPDCVVDLTGGDEQVIMAVGAVAAKLASEGKKNLRVEKYDHERSVVVDCLDGNREIPAEPVELTVEELIALHGGSIPVKTFQPSQDFDRKQLEPLWNLVAKDPKTWNRRVQQLNRFESRADSRTQVYLPLEYLRGVKDFDENEPAVRELLEELNSRGVLENRSSAQALYYLYPNAEIRFCTEKAGNVLEMKTLLEGREVKDGEKPLFHDCRMGACIDWDGVTQESAGTTNEIDVILMQGTTPLFISCKNGDIPDEELYKLNTVANRFGGPYARKMLVVTDLDRKKENSDQAFIQRAEDMGIFLVPEAGKLTPEQWQEKLREAVK